MESRFACFAVAAIKACVECRIPMKVQKTHFVIDDVCDRDVFKEFARQHPEIESLMVQVVLGDGETAEWHAVLPLLPRLQTLAVHMPIDCLFDQGVQKVVLPRLDELVVYSDPGDVVYQFAPSTALWHATRLATVAVNTWDAQLVLGCPLPSLRHLTVGNRLHHDAEVQMPPDVDAGLQRLLRQTNPPLERFQTYRTVSPALLQVILECCQTAALYQTKCEDRINEAVRRRPAQRLLCRRVWLGQKAIHPTDHQDRVAALVESAALPVAHLPELTALFLL